MNYKQLIDQAHRLRCETFIAFAEHGEAHLGGSFSMIEGLIAVYESILQEQDKFILSKAHASFPMCLLLREKGFDPRVATHLEIDSMNGIHATTGSLGHGLPIATGMALGRKLRSIEGRIFVMISDGECQEGTTWESLLIAARHQLSNLVVIVDYNKIQALSTLEDALPLDDLAAKFRAFNWNCEEVRDGHNFSEIIPVLEGPSTNSPRAVLLHTTKGKGIPDFENDPAWHAKKIREKEMKIGKQALGII